MEMVRDAILTELKNVSQELFRRKQEAWDAYAATRERVAEAHDKMISAWGKRTTTREKMNEEYTVLQESIEHCRLVWDKYGQIRDERNTRIEALRAEAESEHRQMVACFNQASVEYETGNKADSPLLAEKGRKHQERRNELNAQIGELIQEIKNAKQNAKDTAVKPDNVPFQAAKAAFESAKSAHEEAQAEFKRLKTLRDEAKAKFDAIQAQYLEVKNAFQERLDVLKAEAQVEREKMLETAGVTVEEQKDAKIVKKTDGSVQIYFGGIGRADGLGHGHIALNDSGLKFYERKAFESHGSQNYKDGGTRCLA